MMKGFLVIALGALLFSACKKEEGDGGKAEIRGTVLEQRYNLSGNPAGDPYPLADHRVSIIYGDGQYYDDDTRTGPNGEYRFPWLRRGSYRVYAISECDDYENCTEAIYETAVIDGRKDIVSLPDITVRNF